MVSATIKRLGLSAEELLANMDASTDAGGEDD